ncbi:hypothetical protein [Thiobacillus sp.]
MRVGDGREALGMHGKYALANGCMTNGLLLQSLAHAKGPIRNKRVDRLREVRVLVRLVDRAVNDQILTRFIIGNRPCQRMWAIDQCVTDPVSDFVPPQTEGSPDAINVGFVFAVRSSRTDGCAHAWQVVDRQHTLEVVDIQASVMNFPKKFHVVLSIDELPDKSG